VTIEQLRTAVARSLAQVLEGSEVEPIATEDVVIERPKSREHGDYATNVALVMAKKAGRNPRELAGELADLLKDAQGIESVDVAGPGFVNITLEAAAQGEVARTVVTAGDSYGHTDTRPDRYIWGIPAGPPWAMRSLECSPRPARAWLASSTSTIAAYRWISSGPR
jgi:arginyl-tRNA synthetase